MRMSIDFLKKIFHRENMGLEATSVEQKGMSAETASAENAEQNAKRTVQSGRSMVEMLGVLAVIGVLSVAGIAGYQYAMNKYRANQIANELNLAGSQIVFALTRPHTEDYYLTLGSPYDDGTLSSGFAFTYGCGTDTEMIGCFSDDTAYYETLSGLPEDLCKAVAQLTQNLPYLVEQRVNDTVDTMGISCNGDDNEIVMLFEINELSNGLPSEDLPFIPKTYYNECTSDEECAWYNGVCYQGFCVQCVTDEDCKTSGWWGGGYCVRGYCDQCVTDQDCGSGSICDDGACLSKKTCSQDSDCPYNQCVDGACRSDECQYDEDCPSNKPFCDRESKCSNSECNSNTDCTFIGKTTCVYDEQKGGNRCQ